MKIGPIGERLQLVIDHYRLNMNKLSVRLGMPSNSIITRIVRDPQRGMSLELLQKILIQFPEINPDWFVTSRGEMLRVPPVVKEPEPCAECLEKEAEIKRLTEKILDCLEEKNKKSDEIIELQKKVAQPN